MPELPEIEIVRRSLFKMINNAKIINVKVKNENLRYKISTSFSKNLIGEKILNIKRRSKYLILFLKKKLLLIHLGMSGKLFIVRDCDKKIFKTSFYYDQNILIKHNHIYFKLNNGFILIYNDVRRFGFLKLYNKKLDQIPFLKELGLEPFNKKFNLNYFKKYVANKKKNIKNILMDQKFVSGLGNIYVNEILYMSKIHPLRIGYNLKEKEIKILIYYIKKILKIAISKGGSSIRDFSNPKGKSGNFQEFFRVYGKEHKNCSRISCRGRIKRIFLSNRSSFYCEKCQK